MAEDEGNMYEKELTIKGVKVFKEGSTKKGKEWKLYHFEVEMDGQNKKMSGFKQFNIEDSGLFLIKESPNPTNTDFPYLNIVKKIEAEPEKVEVKEESVVSSEPDKMPEDTKNLLEGYKQDAAKIEGIVLEANEKELLDKLYALPPDKVNETAFKETVRGHLKGIDPTRVDGLWGYYLKNMK